LGVLFCIERRLFKRIEGVKIGELKELLGAYIMPLFGDENSNCLVVCPPAKSEAVVNEFSQSFDRKLNMIGKLDECFCSLIDKIAL